MRHLLGVLGVLAAGVLLAVSAAMNWNFGYRLGGNEFDGFILGSASVAADCFKALMPFFFFAAIRNKMWSQAAAATVLWVVVAGYSITSAIGGVAQTRDATIGERTGQAATYQDLRADLKRAQDQLSWVPQHRPAAAIEADIDNLQNQRPWTWTEGCTDVTGKQGRDFCQAYHGLTAEGASAKEAQSLETRIAAISDKLAGTTGEAVKGEADPQAAMFATLTGYDQTTIQIAMTLFVALLLEIGSSFGLYVAFSTWRLYDADIVQVPAAPAMATVMTPVAAPVASTKLTAAAAVAVPQTVPGSAPVAATPARIAKPRSGANDNRTAPAVHTPQRLMAPETDVERFYKESVETQDGSSLTATALYEEYCAWCEDQEKEPLALPTFGREFGELGVQKAKVAGRVRYIGIALRSGRELEEDKKSTAFRTQAA